MIQAVVVSLAMLLQPPAQSFAVEPPAWMAGCWVQTLPAGTVEEHWTAPGGGGMIGMGRTIQGTQTVSFEYMRITTVGGRLTFIASPSGAPGILFSMKSMNGEEVVFENLANEFPQRIIYRRGGPGALTARIEGRTSAGTNGVDFAYRRCPATAAP